ncbi:MAG: hypothetical protein AAF657_01710, partial [Acidobacteriota bacterium]
FTWTQFDPAGRSESTFLTLLTSSLLAVIVALDARAKTVSSLSIPAATALFATAAIWIAYQGPSRGALVSVILLVGFTASAMRALLDRGGRLLRDGLDPGVAVPLALGLQLLLRSDLLLAPLFEPRSLVSLLALPVAAGWSIHVLAARFGASRALLAGGVIVVLAPGWTVTSTLAACALAIGVVIADPGRHRAWRWAGVVLLVLLPLWNVPKGILFVAAAMAVAGPSVAPVSLLAVVIAAVAILEGQAHHPIEAIRLWVGAAWLVPAAALAPAEGRWRVRLGALLTLAATLVSFVPEALAAGLAVAVLGVPVAGAGAVLQRAWCATVVLGAAMLRAYPWVREDPRGDLMQLLGWSNEASAFLTLLGLVVGLGLLIDRLRVWAPRWAPRPLWVASLLLGWALVRSVEPTAVLVHSYQPAVLAAATPSWQTEFPRQRIAGLALDSHLLRGAELAPGTPVAVVELVDPNGGVQQEWTLRSGFDTAEWAVSRADLSGGSGIAAPPPWLATVAPNGAFFARRFRSRLAVSPAIETTRLQIRRDDDLPSETVLSIYRLELRR